MKMDKAKVENCIAKTRAFYDTKAVGCALLKVKNIATLPSPALSLTDYTFPDDVYKYLDARAQCTIERLAQRAELADDTVPAEGPWYGIAEHTAFLGGRVDYESDTSWHYAMLDAPGELEKLAMDENNPVFRMVNGGIAYLREKYSDYFLPMVRGASGALEMANTLRGVYGTDVLLATANSFTGSVLQADYNQKMAASMIMPNGLMSRQRTMTGAELKETVRAFVEGCEGGFVPFNRGSLPVVSGIAVEVKEANGSYTLTGITRNGQPLGDGDTVTVTCLATEKQMEALLASDSGTSAGEDAWVKSTWTDYVSGGKAVLAEPENYMTLR